MRNRIAMFSPLSRRTLTMPLSKDDQDAIAVHVKSYAQETIDKQVHRELRGIKFLAAALGITSFAVVISLCFALPDMAAQRVLAQVTSLNSDIGAIITKASLAKT